jgi:type I restriction enzyme S subunit
MSSKKKTTVAKEDGRSTLVPTLRFPEFRDAEEWSGEKLGSKTNKVGSGITPTGGDKNYKQSGRPFVRSQNVGWGELLLDDVAFIDEDTHRSFSSTQIEVLDVLLNITGASIGRSAVADSRIEGGNVNQHVCIIRVKPDELSPCFLNQYLISHDGQKQIDSFQAGGNRQGLNFEQIRSFSIPVPAVFPEQQKIAECLSSVDELMAAQSRKVDALKTHKKGLMQQLFPGEGETQPRLRFPEFQNAAEWEEKRLEDLAKRGSGHTPSKSFPEYYNGGIKWVSLADSKRLDCGLISDTAIEISEKGIQKSSAVLHPEGTVLISRDAGIGKSAVMSIPMAVSQHFIAWICKPRLLSNWFLYHVLQNSKPLFERAATGSTIKTIGLQFFVDLVFRVPLLPEQQRIADCLSSLDDLIAAQTQKLDAFKTHKKGLMQQLFPSPEEIES